MLGTPLHRLGKTIGSVMSIKYFREWHVVVEWHVIMNFVPFISLKSSLYLSMPFKTSEFILWSIYSLLPVQLI